MGVGTLRRYHKPVEVAKAPDVEPGITPTDEEAQAAALANAQKIAGEQQAQADAANEHPDTTAAKADEAEGEASSVAPIIQEAGGVENNPAESAAPTVPVTDQPSDTPGDVSVVTAADLSETEPVDLSPAKREVPSDLNRGSSTAAWRTFAGEGFQDKSRDEIAAHFLGEK